MKIARRRHFGHCFRWYVGSFDGGTQRGIQFISVHNDAPTLPAKNDSRRRLKRSNLYGFRRNLHLKRLKNNNNFNTFKCFFSLTTTSSFYDESRVRFPLVSVRPKTKIKLKKTIIAVQFPVRVLSDYRRKLPGKLSPQRTRS